MTNTVHNLDDATEHFEFTLGGHTYKMRYPTTEEVEKAQKEKKSDVEISEWMYSYIESVSDGAPEFKDAIRKSSVKVLSKFNQMIEVEFLDNKK